MSISKHSGPGLPTPWEQPLMEVQHGWYCKVNPMDPKPAIITYPRTRRSWYKEAQSFMDWLVVLLLASVFLNVYLAFRVLEASK